MRSICSLLVCLALVVGLASPVFSQEKSGLSPEDEMKAWMEAGTPNENHALLNYMVGKWTCTAEMFGPMAGVSSGKCESHPILENRYVETSYQGDMMGMPFSGAGVTGYDNLKKKFFSTWMDSMSTMLFIQWGDYDPTKKTFTYVGEFDDPTGGVQKSRTTIQVVSDDKHIMTMYHGKDRADLPKVMQMTYKRVIDLDNIVALMVDAGCASCQFSMAGTQGCQLAVKISGKPYLVSGAKVDAHSAGLCKSIKKAKCSGKVTGNTITTTSFKILQ